MDNLKEQLNNIPFNTILTNLWIKTFNKWIGSKWLYDWNKKTDWWVLDENSNLINDFSWKRAQWDVISFLQTFFNKDFVEILQYWKDKYWLIDSNNNFNMNSYKTEKVIPKENTKSKSKWETLKLLTDKQKEYITSRWINPNKLDWIVKDYDWMLWIRIFNELWKQITIQRRWIEKKEFRIEAWTNSNWVYMNNINSDIKKVYIVEWMFDFLSLKQFDINVIWLVSNKNWYEVVKDMYSKWYEIILIPDNDEAWKEMLDQLNDIEYKLFDLSKYEVKDINELLVAFNCWEWIIEVIDEESKYKIDEDEEDLDNIDVNDIGKNIPFSWAVPILDNTLWLIDWNQLIILAWEGGSWKTVFTVQQAIENANNWYKVTYMSLEMWSERLIRSNAKKIAWIKMQTEVWKPVIVTKAQKDIFIKEVNRLSNNSNLNIVWYKNILSKESFWEKLDRLAKVSDFIIIDNLWMIWRGEKESELLPLLTQKMLQVRTNNKCSIIALHHMSKWNETQTWPRGKNAIRWSWKVLDDADKIITITRDEVSTKFNSVKDREEWILTSVELIFRKGKFYNDNF